MSSVKETFLCLDLCIRLNREIVNTFSNRKGCSVPIAVSDIKNKNLKFFVNIKWEKSEKKQIFTKFKL